MALRRRRTEFWGEGPSHRETGDFSFHCLTAHVPEEVQRHSHDEAHFVLVLAGGYMSSARGAPDISSTPLLVFNPAGTTHRDRFFGGRGQFLAVSGGAFAEEGGATVMRQPYAIWTARRLAAEVQSSWSPLVAEARALQLVGLVQRPGSDEPTQAVSPPAWLKSAVEMIFTSDGQNLSVADIAAEAGVHPVHLARVFRLYLGCAPGEYLRGRRLERAVSLLGSGLASLAQVSDDAGFCDQAHMTRAFRQRLGATPSTVRDRSRVAPIQDGRLRDA